MISCIHVELAEGSKRGGTTSVSLHYHVIGKLNVCTCFSNNPSDTLIAILLEISSVCGLRRKIKEDKKNLFRRKVNSEDSLVDSRVRT